MHVWARVGVGGRRGLPSPSSLACNVASLSHRQPQLQSNSSPTTPSPSPSPSLSPTLFAACRPTRLVSVAAVCVTVSTGPRNGLMRQSGMYVSIVMRCDATRRDAMRFGTRHLNVMPHLSTCLTVKPGITTYPSLQRPPCQAKPCLYATRLHAHMTKVRQGRYAGTKVAPLYMDPYTAAAAAAAPRTPPCASQRSPTRRPPTDPTTPTLHRTGRRHRHLPVQGSWVDIWVKDADLDTDLN
ncbi:hypothetical protein BKA80DRAFT_40204 [Phyllosticta citrichinensis]